MSPEFDSLMDGIVLFLFFNGIFGMAIRPDLYGVCAMFILGGVLLKAGYGMFKAWRNDE